MKPARYRRNAEGGQFNQQNLLLRAVCERSEFMHWATKNLPAPSGLRGGAQAAIC